MPVPAAACPWLHAALAGQHTGTGMVQLQDAGSKVWQVLQRDNTVTVGGGGGHGGVHDRNW